MPLEPCPECGTEVSDKAEECPSCGVKIDRSTVWQRGCVVLGCAPWIIGILAFIGLTFGNVPGAVLGVVLGLLGLVGYWMQGDHDAVTPDSLG